MRFTTLIALVGVATALRIAEPTNLGQEEPETKCKAGKDGKACRQAKWSAAASTLASDACAVEDEKDAAGAAAATAAGALGGKKAAMEAGAAAGAKACPAAVVAPKEEATPAPKVEAVPVVESSPTPEPTQALAHADPVVADDDEEIVVPACKKGEKGLSCRQAKWGAAAATAASDACATDASKEAAGAAAKTAASAKKAAKAAADAGAAAGLTACPAVVASSLSQGDDPVADAKKAMDAACPGTTEAEKADCKTKTATHTKAVAKKLMDDTCPGTTDAEKETCATNKKAYEKL